MHLRCDDAGHFRAAGTLKDIAAELGLSHEALYRTLATLKRRKLISRPKGGLCIAGKRRPRVR